MEQFKQTALNLINSVTAEGENSFCIVTFSTDINNEQTTSCGAGDPEAMLRGLAGIVVKIVQQTDHSVDEVLNAINKIINEQDLTVDKKI